MNELIEQFITDNLTEDYRDLIRQCFSLFEAYEHQNAYSGFVDLLMEESTTSIEDRVDNFTVELAKQLDYILNLHLTHVTDECTIRERYLILKAYLDIQHLEDYTEILSLCEGDLEATEKMTGILEPYTGIDQARLMEVIDYVADATIRLLVTFIDIQLRGIPEEAKGPLPEHIAEMKLFFVAFGDETLLSELLKADMTPGMPFDSYLPFVGEYLGNPEEKTFSAENFYSLLYISDAYKENPVKVLRDHADRFFPNLDAARLAETEVLTLVGRLNEVRSATRGTH